MGNETSKHCAELRLIRFSAPFQNCDPRKGRICKPLVRGSNLPDTNEIRHFLNFGLLFHVASCCKMFPLRFKHLQSCAEIVQHDCNMIGAAPPHPALCGHDNWAGGFLKI